VIAGMVGARVGRWPDGKDPLKDAAETKKGPQARLETVARADDILPYSHPRAPRGVPRRDATHDISRRISSSRWSNTGVPDKESDPRACELYTTSASWRAERHAVAEESMVFLPKFDREADHFRLMARGHRV